MRRIEVTATTMGGANPSPVTLSGGYRYRGIRDWTPNDPRYRQGERHPGPPPGSPKSSQSRADRMALFAAAREAGEGIAAAGRAAGVTPTTAKTYERERKAALEQGGSRDD